MCSRPVYVYGVGEMHCARVLCSSIPGPTALASLPHDAPLFNCSHAARFRCLRRRCALTVASMVCCFDAPQMKTTIRDMDGELERYHKNTTQLDLSVHGLKEKQARDGDNVMSIVPVAVLFPTKTPRSDIWRFPGPSRELRHVSTRMLVSTRPFRANPRWMNRAQHLTSTVCRPMHPCKSVPPVTVGLAPQDNGFLPRDACTAAYHNPLHAGNSTIT